MPIKKKGKKKNKRKVERKRGIERQKRPNTLG